MANTPASDDPIALTEATSNAGDAPGRAWFDCPATAATQATRKTVTTRVMMRWTPQRPGWSLVVQRERDERVVGAHAGRHHDELASRARPVGHRIRGIRIRNRGAPDFFSRSCVERVEVAIASANEHEAAFGDES